MIAAKTHKTTVRSGVQVSLKELIDLQISAQKLLIPIYTVPKNYWVGGHLSNAKGRGMDFDQVRHYSPGDDVRTMDWRVTARSNKPHIKVYREERERPVILVVDFTTTMFFGTRVAFKSAVAAKVAGLLAWATVLSGDRVGAVLFNDHQEIAIAPKSRQHAVLPMLKAIAELTIPVTEPRDLSAVTLTSVLERLCRVAPSGSMIIIISDFEQAESETKRHMVKLAQRHQLIAGLIYDPFECDIPDVGYAALTDGQEKLWLNTSSEQTRRKYSEQFQLKINDIQRYMNKYGQSFFSLATNQELLPVLHEVLQKYCNIRR